MASIADDAKCRYVFLGNSGLRVSNISLGTATFGEFPFPGQLSEKDAHEVMDRFVEWGGNFFDTANVYGRGTSEKIVGSWLSRQQRDRFVVATKVRILTDPSNPNAVGLGRRHIMRSVQDSLERLNTDYIDLLQTHLWDDGVPIEETLMTLNDLVTCGKVRYLGVSNVTGWQMQKIVEVSKQRGLNPFISLQQQYSLMSRWSELEPFQVCKLNGLGVLPWSPLRGGFLSGKYTRGQTPQEGRMGWIIQNSAEKMENVFTWPDLNQEKHWNTLDTVQNIAKTKGKSVAQVSLRWLLQKPVVSSIIIGVTSMSQLDDNMAAANGWTLTPEEMEVLDEVSKIELPYPYDLIRRLNKPRTNPWNASPVV